MKNIQLFIITTIAISLITVILVNPSKAVSQKQKIYAAAIPDSVRAILTNSCLPCHTTGGKDIALAAWNLSAIDNYSTKKLAKKAKSIYKAIRDTTMPPAKYLAAHPDKLPTIAQTKIIYNWAKSLQKK